MALLFAENFVYKSILLKWSQRISHLCNCKSVFWIRLWTSLQSLNFVSYIVSGNKYSHFTCLHRFLNFFFRCNIDQFLKTVVISVLFNATITVYFSSCDNFEIKLCVLDYLLTFTSFGRYNVSCKFSSNHF